MARRVFPLLLLVSRADLCLLSDIRLERIPQTSERAAALLVDACTKFEGAASVLAGFRLTVWVAAAINETADDAEALYYWGCALQLRGTQAAAAPVSFRLDLDREMQQR